jgi:hypothetical protein
MKRAIPRRMQAEPQQYPVWQPRERDTAWGSVHCPRNSQQYPV